jgi:hypothetical protein
MSLRKSMRGLVLADDVVDRENGDYDLSDPVMPHSRCPAQTTMQQRVCCCDWLVRNEDVTGHVFPGMDCVYRRGRQADKDAIAAMDQPTIEDLFLPETFDVDAGVASLSSTGFHSFRLLQEDFRLLLVKETHTWQRFTPAEEWAGPHKVHQQVSVSRDFRPGGPFLLLGKLLQQMLDRAFDAWRKSGGSLAVSPCHPFSTPLLLNRPELNRYEPGSVGITPHRDPAASVNVVCIFPLEGEGRLYRCTDRSGRDASLLDGRLGNCIMMRAPGFLDCTGETGRPFHFVTEIRSRRHSFILRQERSAFARNDIVPRGHPTAAADPRYRSRRTEESQRVSCFPRVSA